MSAIIPLTGTEAQRQYTFAHGGLVADEIHSTTDQGRFFYYDGTNDNFIGPHIRHPDVGSEADMLALNATATQGCWPGDTVMRTDQTTKFTCISNHGELITDWEADAASSDTDIDGGNFTETITSSDLDVDGGTFA